MTNNALENTPLAGIQINKINNELQKQLILDLASIWREFIRELESTPVIQSIECCEITLDDYFLLMKDMRQQIIHGVNWIARMGSSFDPKSSPAIEKLRNTIIGHAAEENKDYQMVEKDFVAAGGDLNDIRTADMNIGSMALDTFMMHEASKYNPIGMIGSIFIIEGVGAVKASLWADKIASSIKNSKAVGFLSYHGKHDQDHQGIVERILVSPLINEKAAFEIKRVSKICGMLYANQYRTLGRYI